MILRHWIICVLLNKAKAVTWKFSKFKTEKSVFKLRLTYFFLTLILKIQDTHVQLISTESDHQLVSLFLTIERKKLNYRFHLY
jgi:hypothetical protein